MAVSETAARLTRGFDDLFRPHPGRRPDRIGVAVSGGGDSMALLRGALDWARARGLIHVQAATVDHGLRPEAAAEARAVAAFCAQHDVPHEILRIGLTPGPGLQARARAGRYDALRVWAARAEVGPVLLGHTADDVAEGLLMRLARGTGLDGLAQMPDWWQDAAGGNWGRPLLRLTRAELRGYLRDNAVAWAEDPSNDDPAFERVRIRQQMQALGLDPQAIASSARALADACRTLDAQAHRFAQAHIRIHGGDVLIEAEGVRAWDELHREEPSLHRRLSAAILRWIGGKRPRGAELDRLVEPVDGDSRLTLAGVIIERRSGTPASGQLRYSREPAACGPAVPLGAIWDGRWQVTPPPDWAGDPSRHLVSALGDHLPQDWRKTGLPRDTLRASPALRDGAGTLVAAPLLRPGSGWTATVQPDFLATLRPRRREFR